MTLALKKLSWEELHKPEASLSYTVNFRSVWALGLQRLYLRKGLKDKSALSTGKAWVSKYNGMKSAEG